MRISIRGHFDGRVIVPDEPVGDLPHNVPLSVDVSVVHQTVAREAENSAEEAYQELLTLAVVGANISDEALRRENLYEDRS